MPAETETAIDVAMWFADQALNHNEYLQPQKLHRLLYLAQGYYAVAYSGRKLMPAVFVAEDMGPIEPNVFKAFSKGRPSVEMDSLLSERVVAFLEGIWRRFGHYSAEHLTRLAKETEAYVQARKRARRAEITIEAMRLSFTRAEKTPALKQVIRPKVMRSHTGKPVTVKSWTPGTKTDE
jgi:uncharacterized phage-associated protein